MLNEIHCGDCTDVLKTMPDEHIDLTVTSPPYDNLRTYNGFVFDFEGIAKELYRVTKPGGVVVWVVGDATVKGSETGTSFRQALYFKDVCGFNLHDTMIYEKDGVGARGSNYCYWQVFEYMFVLSKGTPSVARRIKDSPNKWAGSSTYGKAKRRNNDGELVPVSDKIVVQSHGFRTNIWRIPTGQSKTTKDRIAYEHPAIFPEKLAEDHIISWSNPGDTVLDPMCGSGTTCKMAAKNGRQYIGIDISEEYCEIARKRIASIQPSLALQEG